MTIQGIRDKILSGEYRFPDHAVKRMIQREIARYEIEEVILNGKIIEEYPEDKYSPSCLIFGKTAVGRELFITISLPPRVVVITTYEPDSKE